MNGRLEQDRFEDEIAVVMDTDKGAVVLLGCSHPGMKNMLAAVRERLERPIYAVLGGTHLVESTKESLVRSMAFFSGAGYQSDWSLPLHR